MVISSARSLGSRSRAMEYRRLGTGGTAFKTIDRNRSSLLHFNAFLETKGLGLFENLEEGEVCKVDLLQEFGTFLCYHARNSKTDDLLMQNSAFGYMSGVKESIRLRFPDNPIFQESYQEWYTKLREGMGTIRGGTSMRYCYHKILWMHLWRLS